MKIMGIICEYNPFHKGHEFQLKTHKNELSADGVICLMSGNFVQRGAPAIYDKWTRAKTAILNGADLVLELPVVYSSQSAMRFAYGSVSVLNALGCVNYLSFGSECGDINKLFEAQEIVFSKVFKNLVSEEMKNGLSYPAARSEVLKKHYHDIDCDLISRPNNILALEYLNSLKILKSKIEPKTLTRNFDFISASEIREKISNNEDISPYVPQKSDGKAYDKNAFDTIVSYHFRKETAENLKTIADVAEGLENRFIKCSNSTFGFDDLSEAVKTKRYTKTRIDRIIINALLGITDSDTEKPPRYARVLAFNDTGAKIINEIKENSSVPVITKLTDFVNSENSDLVKMLEKDILATDIYSLLTCEKSGGKDFTTSPLYIK